MLVTCIKLQHNPKIVLSQPGLPAPFPSVANVPQDMFVPTQEPAVCTSMPAPDPHSMPASIGKFASGNTGSGKGCLEGTFLGGGRMEWGISLGPRWTGNSRHFLCFNLTLASGPGSPTCLLVFVPAK